MKRFTDTCKWDDPWFRSLTGVQKLIFLYVIDRCNNAGFWERDDDSLAFHTKLKPDLIEGAWKGLGRGLFESEGWVWVRRFLRHQKNEDLKPENPAHKQIIALLSEQQSRFESVSEFSSFIAPFKPLLRGIGKGKGNGEGKEKKGSAEGKQTKSKASQDEVLAFIVESELPKSDAEWFFNKCEANGWTNSGEPIKDWKATIRSWKAAGYMPSQKNGAKPDGKPTVKTHYLPGVGQVPVK